MHEGDHAPILQAIRIPHNIRSPIGGRAALHCPDARLLGAQLEASKRIHFDPCRNELLIRITMIRLPC